MDQQFVLAVGNPFDGITLYGPFALYEDAEDKASRIGMSEWWIMALVDPKRGG